MSYSLPTATVRDKSRGIDEHLIRLNTLTADELGVLRNMTDLHAARFGGDAKRSLANLSGASDICEELNRIASDERDALQAVATIHGNANVSARDDGETAIYGTVVQIQAPTANLNVPGAPSRFRIVKEYAKGGLGVVFVAEELQIRREVALKQIRMDCTDVVEYREKFNREAELTGQLEHPGIDPVYALGTDESGRPYYAMRFVSGEDLKSHIRKYHDTRNAKNQRFDRAEWRKLAAEATKECDESKAALLLFAQALFPDDSLPQVQNAFIRLAEQRREMTNAEVRRLFNMIKPELRSKSGEVP